MTEHENTRPDPLAPPEGYGQKPAEYNLEVCSVIVGASNLHCSMEVTEIWWFGCTTGEHAGPLSYCAMHAARPVLLQGVCGQCNDAGCYSRINWLRREDTAGENMSLPERRGVLQTAFDQIFQSPRPRLLRGSRLTGMAGTALITGPLPPAGMLFCAVCAGGAKHVAMQLARAEVEQHERRGAGVRKWDLSESLGDPALSVAWGVYPPLGAALPLCWTHLLAIDIRVSGILPAAAGHMPGSGPAGAVLLGGT